MKGLTNKQRETLFSKAERAKTDGKTLTAVFKEFAQKEGRAFGSIRNYYYKCIADGSAGSLTAKTNEFFTESAENELIARFLRGRAVFGSMRKTALSLADGDPILALRYQNKMYNLLKKKRDIVQINMKNLSTLGENYYDPFLKKSVEAKSADLLSNSEFNGLIRIIDDSRQNRKRKKIH